MSDEAAYKRNWRAKHKEMGLCSDCNNPVFPGSSQCYLHLVNTRVRRRERMGSKSYWETGLGRPPMESEQV